MTIKEKIDERLHNAYVVASYANLDLKDLIRGSVEDLISEFIVAERKRIISMIEEAITDERAILKRFPLDDMKIVRRLEIKTLEKVVMRLKTND